MTAPDALAISMSVALSFALGSLVTLFCIIARNAKSAKQRTEELNLPEEEKPSPLAKAAPSPADDSSAEEWSKNPDWWKK